MNRALAEQNNALHKAVEVFNECESYRIIKTALKKRVYSQPEDISPGSWIYFKNDKKWEGPVKITTKDGKLLYAIRAGRLLTINSDHAVIAKFEGVLLRNKDKNSKSDCPQVEVQTSAEEEREKTDIVVAPNLNEQEEEGDETSATGQDLEVESNIPNTGEVMPLEIESLDSSDNSQVQHSQSAEERNQVHLKDLRRFDVIKFRTAGENVFSKGELMERPARKGE